MFDSKSIEKEVRQFWEDKKIIEAIIKFDDRKKKKFYLLDGPPYANGLPHAGHAMTIIFKDIWGKFKHMQGYSVWWKPGFDCHGLPIENKVEKLLEVRSKHDIEDRIGADKFIAKCREFSTSNLTEWMDFFKRVGAWKGWLTPYLTHDNHYIESGWWTIKTLYEKGLLVKGEKPIHWCPHCETPLSGYETTDSYKDVEDPSIYMKFPMSGKEGEFFVAWTTTPWTLPANVALAAHPDEDYVRIEAEKDGEKEKYVMAKALSKEVMEKAGIKKYKILETFKGKKLEGEKYDPLLDVPIQRELHKKMNAHQVVMSIPILKKAVGSKIALKKELGDEETASAFGHLVTMDTGTGMVHIAPGHGVEDNKVGEHYKLPVLSPVDEAGKLMAGTGFEGVFVKTADKMIVEHLEAHNRILKSERVVHSYPLCWRCKSPLVYRLSKQWFFPIDTIKQKMIKENQKVNWLPPFGKERMNKWLSDEEDWCVSCQRFWGIPLPIWECASCGRIKVIGSAKELEEAMSNKGEDKVKLDDLHKHVVDKVTVRCECGKSMKRISDLFNIWVESGIAPWASLGYPYYDDGMFKKLWRLDLVDESQDQIRGWFNALMFMGMATFGERPYETVCMNGWTLDEKGVKMSKSLGNVVSAEDCFNNLGADVLRLYNCYGNAPWETQKFSLKGAKELDRVLDIFMNIVSFAKMYGISAECLNEKLESSDFEHEDRWILSRANTLIKEVTDDLENFRFHYVGRKVSDFILNDFSRWYVKLIRDRISDEKEKKVAGYVLLSIIDSLAKIMAPITPFVSEKIYQELLKQKGQRAKVNAEESVHFCAWPKEDAKMIDSELESGMNVMKEMIELANSERQEAGIKLKWPVARFIVETKDKDAMRSLVIFGKVFNRMANSKKLELLKGAKGKEWIERKFSAGTLYLDPARDEKLIEEAMVRELIRQVQVMRKKAGKSVSETINLSLSGQEEVLGKWAEEIEKGTSSKVVLGKPSGKNKADFSFEEKKIEIGF